MREPRCSPLGLLILVTWGSAQAQVGSLPAPPFGYVMSQQSSTLLVVDTRTNDIVTKVKHPDLVRPAGGRFHPSLKRYYASGTGKITIWDTTDVARHGPPGARSISSCWASPAPFAAAVH